MRQVVETTANEGLLLQAARTLENRRPTRIQCQLIDSPDRVRSFP